jgi:hypothetical protein
MKRLLLTLCLCALPACGGAEGVDATTENLGIGSGTSVIYSGPGERCGWEYICNRGLVCEGLDLLHNRLGVCVTPGSPPPPPPLDPLPGQ